MEPLQDFKSCALAQCGARSVGRIELDMKMSASETKHVQWRTWAATTGKEVIDDLLARERPDAKVPLDEQSWENKEDGDCVLQDICKDKAASGVRSGGGGGSGLDGGGGSKQPSGGGSRTGDADATATSMPQGEGSGRARAGTSTAAAGSSSTASGRAGGKGKGKAQNAKKGAGGVRAGGEPGAFPVKEEGAEKDAIKGSLEARNGKDRTSDGSIGGPAIGRGIGGTGEKRSRSVGREEVRAPDGGGDRTRPRGRSPSPPRQAGVRGMHHPSADEIGGGGESRGVGRASRDRFGRRDSRDGAGGDNGRGGGHEPRHDGGGGRESRGRAWEHSSGHGGGGGRDSRDRADGQSSRYGGGGGTDSRDWAWEHSSGHGGGGGRDSRDRAGDRADGQSSRYGGGGGRDSRDRAWEHSSGHGRGGGRNSRDGAGDRSSRHGGGGGRDSRDRAWEHSSGHGGGGGRDSRDRAGGNSSRHGGGGGRDSRVRGGGGQSSGYGPARGWSSAGGGWGGCSSGYGPAYGGWPAGGGLGSQGGWLHGGWPAGGGWGLQGGPPHGGWAAGGGWRSQGGPPHSGMDWMRSGDHSGGWTGGHSGGRMRYEERDHDGYPSHHGRGRRDGSGRARVPRAETRGDAGLPDSDPELTEMESAAIRYKNCRAKKKTVKLVRRLAEACSEIGVSRAGKHYNTVEDAVGSIGVKKATYYRWIKLVDDIPISLGWEDKYFYEARREVEDNQRRTGGGEDGVPRASPGEGSCDSPAGSARGDAGSDVSGGV
eukprot:g4216.t1